MSESPKVRGAYGSGRATKEAILVAATELFGDKGYYGFSLRDVAKIVGISHPAVIYHFPTKEALLFSTMARWHSQLGIDAVKVNPGTGETSVGDYKHSLTGLGAALLRLTALEEFPMLARFDSTMATEAASPGHPLHDHYSERMQHIRALIVERVDLLAEEKWCVPLFSSEGIADMLIGAWYGGLIVSEYPDGLEPGQYLVGRLLALAGKILQLGSDGLLAIAAAVPEELAGSFQRVLIVNRELTR